MNLTYNIYIISAIGQSIIYVFKEFFQWIVIESWSFLFGFILIRFLRKKQFT